MHTVCLRILHMKQDPFFLVSSLLSFALADSFLPRGRRPLDDGLSIVAVEAAITDRMSLIVSFVSS